MTIGPIQAFVIGFPDNDLFEGRVADELARLSNFGQIEVVDAVFVMREGDDVATFSVTDLDADQRAELRAEVGTLVGLGIAGDQGAVAGAELGASIDLDAATAAQVVAASLVDELSRRELSPRARHRAPVGRPVARRRARCRRLGARVPVAHP